MSSGTKKRKAELLGSTAHINVELDEEEQCTDLGGQDPPHKHKPKPRKQRPPQQSERAKPPARGPPVEPMAYSIQQFCAAHDLCVETYYRMQRAGAGPTVMKVGARTLISIEAAAAWRREREAAARKQRGERIATEPEVTA